MSISYNKLFHELIDRGITSATLMKGSNLSANILTRMKRNEYISLESIEKICAYLSCTPNDILEFIESSTSNHEFTAISLFTGAGGMDVGFESAGVKIVLANELMKEMSETYCANRPAAVMLNDDVHNIFPELEKYKGVDFVFGGPPCQGFSIAGKMNPEDERSQLIFTFLDVVEVVQPKAFVMENVKALGVLDKWEAVRNKYFERTAELGYTCYSFVLNATEYGVSQKRERVFFVGVKNDKNPFMSSRIETLIEEQKHKAPTIRELLKPLGRAGTKINPHTCTAKITFATHPIMRKSPYAGMYFNGQGRPIDIDGYANTLPASMGGNKTPFIDEEFLYGDATEDWVVKYHKGLMDGSITPSFEEAPERLRRITVKEAAKIQTFPDDYVFCGSKGMIYTQIGNAVPCKLAEVVAKAVTAYLREESK